VNPVKRIEIAVRTALVRWMSRWARRSRPLDDTADLNRATILLVRQDRIGDVLISTPLVAALARHYPGAAIDFFLSRNNAFVLENDARVRKRWVYTKGILSSLKLLGAIRRQRYDFVVDLMDNPSTTSTLLCAFCGARWTVGIAKENDFVYDVTVPLRSRRDVHIVDRIAQLLTPFGIDPDAEELALEYAVQPGSKAFADRTLRDLGISSPVVGVNISPAVGARYWGADKYRTLLESIVNHHPEQAVLLLYEPKDRPQAEQIGDGLAGVYLSPPTRSFDHFAALVERLSLLVTPDTSAVHLGAAFRIPVVALYVQSDPSLRVWDPYGTRSAVHVTDVDDLTTIPAGEVIESVERLLAEVAPAAAGRPADGAGSSP
jgi:ADP-heptose:LPS heptosyltransferase